MAPPRIAILSEDPLARSGLSALLAGRGEVAVVGQASPGEPGALAALAAEVALLDTGAGGAVRIRDLPGIPVVALVADEAQAAVALAAGAHGAVLRDAGPERLAAALVAAHHGLFPLDPALAEWIRPLAPAAGGGQEALTPREKEALGLLAEGLPNKVIAQRLGVAERTAKFHVESILAKLGAESRSEAIVIAARRGLVTL